MPELTEEQIARRFHEAYERLAPEHGYKTRDATAVPWDQVPDNNRALMIATVADACQPLLAEVDRLKADYEARGNRIESLKREVTKVSLVARRTEDDNDRLKAELAEARQAFADKVQQQSNVMQDWAKEREHALARVAELEARAERMTPVVEAVGKWAEARQSPRSIATDSADRALILTYGFAVDAYNASCVDGCAGHTKTSEEAP